MSACRRHPRRLPAADHRFDELRRQQGPARSTTGAEWRRRPWSAGL